MQLNYNLPSFFSTPNNTTRHLIREVLGSLGWYNQRDGVRNGHGSQNLLGLYVCHERHGSRGKSGVQRYYVNMSFVRDGPQSVPTLQIEPSQSDTHKMHDK
jgi:hypothetical protein